MSGDCLQASISGGDGNDLIDASANNFGVFIHGDAGDDTIYGSAHDDLIYGDEGTDTVFALGGNDGIFSTEYAHGGDGTDTLHNAASAKSYDGIEQVLLNT
jgi:Ca2+-binding RTX toxin-like protein